ncbi:MAG: ATP-binding cassette domain-containing protein, partial [Halofilum sp. (in: g-proteobacteria)]
DAIAELSLTLPAGEMAFLTGHSGAGKSTLLKLLARIERVTRGTLLVDNVNLATLPRRRVPWLRRRMGIVFQNHQLLYDRTVFDNVALPLVVAGYGSGELRRRTRAALDKVGLADKERRMPITLSGGEQQRVGIARAVVHRPTLLIADEPTGNLDPELSREIMELFVAFNRVGVTVLVATHDIALTEAFGLPVLTLADGRLVRDDFAGRDLGTPA